MKFAFTAMALLLWMASIQGFAVQVGEDVVRDKVKAYVREQVAPSVGKANLDVDVTGVSGAPFDFPETESVSEVRFDITSPLSQFYSDRAVVRVSMTTPGGRTRDIGVPVKLTVTKPVWVVKHFVPANAKLKRANLELVTRDVSRDLQHVAGAELDLTRYIARVNLAPGQLLDTRRLQVPPDVRQYEEVMITLSNNKGMNISVVGTALANASIGDTVRVRHGSLNRKKYYTGTVVSKNRVQVDI